MSELSGRGETDQLFMQFQSIIIGILRHGRLKQSSNAALVCPGSGREAAEESAY